MKEANADLRESYARISSEIKKASPRATLIAVSKSQPVDAIEELYRLGHRDFGENYVQELLAKAPELQDRRGCSDIRWHFIGHLQTNKVKQLLPWIASLHTLDSERLAEEISKRWRATGREGKLPAFVEINIDREASKSGLEPSGAAAFARGITEKFGSEIEVQGLMCVPASDRADAKTRASFQRLRELEKACRESHPSSSRGFLSMGMSSDYLAALAEGATHVRVGTALFGKRK